MELYEWGWIKKIPRIAVINAEGANTLDVLYNGKFEDTELRWNNGNFDTELIERYYTKMNDDGIRPKTKATAIQIGKPSNLLKGLRALEFTNGIVISVTDKEMLDGMSVVGLNGFDCEMASGAVPAGIKKLLDDNIMKKDDEIVGILTGRQKEPLLPINYHNDPTNQFAKPPKQ
jgi:threonine synthase